MAKMVTFICQAATMAMNYASIVKQLNGHQEGLRDVREELLPEKYRPNGATGSAEASVPRDVSPAMSRASTESADSDVECKPADECKITHEVVRPSG